MNPRARNLSLLPVLLLAALGCTVRLPGSSPAVQPVDFRSLATRAAHSIQATDTAAGPIATATAQHRASYLAERMAWPVSLVDDFQDNHNEWPVGDESGELSEIYMQIDSGSYRWQATALQGFVYWVHPSMEAASDFILTAEMQQLSGPDSAECGVVFRLLEDDDSYAYYLFRLENSGRYGLDLRLNGEWYTLINLTDSPAIRPNQVNQVRVVAEGAHFLFYINQQSVAEIDDDSLASGYAGTAVGLYETGAQGTFAFTRFELRTPQPVEKEQSD